jgi:DNA-binding GntR family transcriptional regulator
MEQGLAEAAYSAIKTNILNLTYAPGSPLSEAGLALELGLGRMPVRLAVKRLKAEGWLVAEFRCQIKVKNITAKDIQEIYQLRRLLGEHALAQIFKNGLTWDYSFRLEEKLLKIKAARKDLFVRELAESAWHLEMLKVLGNDRLERVYAAVQEEAVRIALSYMRREGDDYVDGIIKGLERFCSALREKRFEEARLILERDHWQGGQAQALAALDNVECRM